MGTNPNAELQKLNKGFERNRLLADLPIELGEQILAKTRDYLKFLAASGALTNTTVRTIYNNVENQVATLVGEIEAAKVQAKGGGRDEMDAWEENRVK